MNATNRGVCRTCGAPMLWTITSKGKRMPVDPQPVADGNVVLTELVSGGYAAATIAEYARVGWTIDADQPRYRSHFASCPGADQHRRRRAL